MSPRPVGSEAAVTRAMGRGGAVPALVVLVLTATVLAALQGWSAAASGALGGAVALGAFWVGTAGIRLILTLDPSASLPLALGWYALQVLLLLAVALMLRGQPWLDGTALAAGLLTAALAYQIGQVRAFLRTRTLLVESVAERICDDGAR